MSVSPPPPLRRPPRGRGRIAFGVRAALAERWGVSPGLVRLIAAVGALTGVGVLVYLGVAAATPVAGTDGPPLAPPRLTAGLANGLMLAIRGAAWLFVAVGLGLAAGGLTLVEQLTPRERDVLQLIARGYAYKQVAVRLDISARTVETHVRAVLHKLQLSSRHELARWASARGLDGGAPSPRGDGSAA